MPKSQQSWVQFQYSPTQWNLRGGRRSSVEYSTKKKNQQNPPVKKRKKKESRIKIYYGPFKNHLERLSLERIA
jgi:hypothetical protein